MVDDSSGDNQNKADGVEQVTWFGAAETRVQQTAAPPARPDAEPLTLLQPTVAQSEKSDKTEATALASKDHSSMLAQTVVTAFTERLTTEARKRGGYLTIGDIDQLGREFDRKRVALEAVFQQSFEAYVKIRERAAFDHARKYPFDRVVVNSFAHLFDQKKVASDGPDAVTRLILPGFFMAIEKMVGPETMEEFQVHCRKIVARLSGDDDVNFDWRLIYDDPEAQGVCLDALVDFAPYFEDIDHRRDWFIPLVNNQLDAEDAWQLSEGGFRNFVSALFSELREGLADQDRRAELEKKYSGVTCFELDRVFEKIDKAWT